MKFLSNCIIVIVLNFLFICPLYSQDISNNTFGKGIRLTAKDSSFYIKFSTRFQNRYEGIYSVADGTPYSDRFYLRRARLKFDGFVYSPAVVYKIEYDAVGNEMLDVVVKWNFYKNFTLWFGQTKLPGNVERIISSQKLQFVDRSLLNDRYNIDRDKGVQLRHRCDLGGMIIRETASVSQGEGKNFNASDNTGYDYTGRLEILPMGNFTNKGEYMGSDVERESSPKLMIGVAFDFNDKAYRTQGQRGDVLTVNRSIQTIFADVTFKYRGFSFLGEYADKSIYHGNPVISDENGELEEVFQTGTGLNTQAGYLFRNNVELAYRYTNIHPEDATEHADIIQHTIGVSRYIVKHSLKVQSDISLTEEESEADYYSFRLQVELSF